MLIRILEKFQVIYCMSYLPLNNTSTSLQYLYLLTIPLYLYLFTIPLPLHLNTTSTSTSLSDLDDSMYRVLPYQPGLRQPAILPAWTTQRQRLPLLSTLLIHTHPDEEVYSSCILAGMKSMESRRESLAKFKEGSVSLFVICYLLLLFLFLLLLSVSVILLLL